MKTINFLIQLRYAVLSFIVFLATAVASGQQQKPKDINPFGVDIGGNQSIPPTPRLPETPGLYVGIQLQNNVLTETCSGSLAESFNTIHGFAFGNVRASYYLEDIGGNSTPKSPPYRKMKIMSRGWGNRTGQLFEVSGNIVKMEAGPSLIASGVFTRLI